MNWRWVRDVVVTWVIIALCMIAAVATQNVAVCIAAVLILGTRQHALAVLGHDGIHGHAANNRKLSNWLARLFCFWPIGASVTYYSRFHFAHHAHLGTPKDPEKAMILQNPRMYAEANTPLSIVSDLCGLSAPGFIKAQKTSDLSSVVSIIAFLTMLGVAIALGYWLIAVLWLVSLYTSFLAVFRQRTFTEHIGTMGTIEKTKPALWRRLIYLPCGTWLHWEHHRWPGVPVHKLSKLTKD